MAGRRLKEETLREMDADTEFLEYITGIGFDWLLEPCAATMPKELAQEFFTSFHFTYDIDVEAESIHFRLFIREVRLSLREWSVRLGLYTADQEVEWFDRDIGHPKDIKEYDEQAAWAEMVPMGTEPYKKTESTADCIKNLVLLLAQIFFSVNLLCQANTFKSITAAELYFLWCMMKKKKVHLGYWLACTCQSISSRAARHLNGYHIIGAIVSSSVQLTWTRKIHKMEFCPTPELFGSYFLCNVEVLKKKGGVFVFYEVKRPELQPKEATEKNETRKVEVMLTEPEEEAR